MTGILESAFQGNLDHRAAVIGLLKHFPGVGTGTDVVGRAMIAAVRSGAPSHAVEIREINTLGAADTATAAR